jgi:hypothetical protein
VLIAALIRKRKYPEKSLKNAIVSVVLTPVRALRLGPFKQKKIDIDGACKHAMKKTGLKDFGNSAFISAYNSIINTKVHQSLQFSNLGFISARIEMNQTMVRRLMFLNYIQENPDVLKVPLRSKFIDTLPFILLYWPNPCFYQGPVFVMGLPRTGTTFLHRLLSLDPAVRSPLLWELFAPVPGVKGDASKDQFEADATRRAKFMKKLVGVRKSMGDKALEHIHEIEYDLPEECLLSLSDELPCNPHLFYSSYVQINELLRITAGDVVNDAYAYYKKVLQLLSYQNLEREDPRRWVLKCPIHLFYIKAIAKVFPDAKLIWTHRDPVSAVPSLCSLLKSFHQVYYESDTRDDMLLGKVLCSFTADLLEQAPKDIKETGLPCSDIIYNDLVENPVKIVKDIYAKFGWEYTKAYDDILNKYLDDNRRKREEIKLKRQKKGISAEDTLHKYEPEEFGLTAEELSTGKYAAYKKAFNVPMSKN